MVNKTSATAGKGGIISMRGSVGGGGVGAVDAVVADNNMKNKFNVQGDDADDAAMIKLSKNEIIKKFDNKYKDANETAVVVAAEPIVLRSHQQQHDDEKRVSSEKSFSDEENNRSSESSSDNSYKNGSNGGGTNGSTPPKPLPRTSRNNSVSDQGLSAEDATGNGGAGGMRPVARPRTAATYKVDEN